MLHVSLYLLPKIDQTDNKNGNILNLTVLESS